MRLSVISQDGAGRDIGTVRDIAGKNGHRRLQHGHIRRVLFLYLGARLHSFVTASGNCRKRSVEMIERIHVKHHFSSYWQRQFLARLTRYPPSKDIVGVVPVSAYRRVHDIGTVTNAFAQSPAGRGLCINDRMFVATLIATLFNAVISDS